MHQSMNVICLCVSVLISAYQIHARMGFTSFSSLVTKHKDWSLHILKKSTTPLRHNDTSQWWRFWGCPKPWDLGATKRERKPGLENSRAAKNPGYMKHSQSFKSALEKARDPQHQTRCRWLVLKSPVKSLKMDVHDIVTSDPSDQVGTVVTKTNHLDPFNDTSVNIN